jgi:hypothetical protein
MAGQRGKPSSNAQRYVKMQKAKHAKKTTQAQYKKETKHPRDMKHVKNNPWHRFL